MLRTRARAALFGAVAFATVAAVVGATASADGGHGDKTATPIKHLVVIFQENVSFDHYFGTYPEALRTPTARRSPRRRVRPRCNGLSTALLAHNPNLAPPKRLDSSPTGLAGDPGGQITCDQDHNYSDEQQSFDSGAMDQFVQSVGTDGGTHNPGGGTTSGGALCDPKIVMDYYDGNSVTALWNYAQRFSMSDNSFGTTFGPSAPGAINVTSGNTGGVDTAHEANSPSVATSTAPDADITPDGLGGYSLTSDAQPYWDDCSTRDAVALKGTNIGDELNAAGISWGWFQGGFAPTTTLRRGRCGERPHRAVDRDVHRRRVLGTFTGKVVPTGASNQALCDAVHPVGVALGETAATHQFGFKDDYIAHHEPFQYYATTANPHHLAPASLASIGTDTQQYVGGVPQFDTANHNYDTSDFDRSSPRSPRAVAGVRTAGGHVPEGAGLRGRTRRVLRPGRRAAVPRQRDQRAREDARLVEHGGDRQLRRLRRLVRPRLQRRHERHRCRGADNLTNTVKGTINATNPTSQQCGAASRRRLRRSQASRAAAVSGRACRCSSSRRARGRTRSTAT